MVAEIYSTLNILVVLDVVFISSIFQFCLALPTLLICKSLQCVKFSLGHCGKLAQIRCGPIMSLVEVNQAKLSLVVLDHAQVKLG